MSKRFIVILLVCVLALVGIYITTSKKEDTNTSGGDSSLSEHIYGENKKGVTLVEYGDFQCPACAQYFPIVKQIKEKYGDDIQFQFRNYPLSQIHPNARAASRAAEAASKQGKFWEMHDMLYEQQSSWSSLPDAVPVFGSYAQQLSLNMEQYNADFSDVNTNNIINADYAEGNKLGVSSTPTFFLQGKKIEKNPQTLDEFSKLIDEAIKEAEANKE